MRIAYPLFTERQKNVAVRVDRAGEALRNADRRIFLRHHARAGETMSVAQVRPSVQRHLAPGAVEIDLDLLRRRGRVRAPRLGGYPGLRAAPPPPHRPAEP